MFKTFKNILAVAVSISLLTISNAVADGHMAAIKKWSNGEFSLSTISANHPLHHQLKLLLQMFHLAREHQKQNMLQFHITP